MNLIYLDLIYKMNLIHKMNLIYLLVLDIMENEYNLDLKNIGFFKGKSRGK